ncbi:adenosylmethionine decarboxylase [Candidatus Woesearchaeota archaeon]|nr:adenosylmethionine decarboxylase [Candidatus Woesearchaeota archaeon]
MKVKKIHGKGNHLIVDAVDVNSKILDDKRFIKNFLKELPKVVEMHTLTRPKVIRATPKEYDTGGITGFVILSESNISIHTYPQEGKFYLDLFSCMEFNVDKAMSYIKEKFQLKNFKKSLLKRGNY